MYTNIRWERTKPNTNSTEVAEASRIAFTKKADVGRCPRRGSEWSNLMHHQSHSYNFGRVHVA